MEKEKNCVDVNFFYVFNFVDVNFVVLFCSVLGFLGEKWLLDWSLIRMLTVNVLNWNSY